VFNRFAIRKRLTRAFSLLVPLVLAAFTSPIARASSLHALTLSDTPDCSVSGDSLKCHLLQILSFLYFLAGILGFVLLIVVAIAARIYVKNKRNRQVRP
jgi:hypothetical protein